MTVADALNGIRERTQEKTTAAEVLQSLRKNVASLQSVAAHGPVVIDPVHVLLLIDSELERLPENKIAQLEKRLTALEHSVKQHVMDSLPDQTFQDTLIAQKLEEYGGPVEAYKELVAIHKLFDDEFGHPYEGDESLSQLVAGAMQQLRSLRERMDTLSRALNEQSNR